MKEFKETELMLYQAECDFYYAWTPTLCKRNDMRPVNKATADATMAVLKAERKKEANGEFEMATDNAWLAKEEAKKEAEVKKEIVEALPETVQKAVIASEVDANAPSAPTISKSMSKADIIAMAKKDFDVDLDSSKNQPALLKELKLLSMSKKG